MRMKGRLLQAVFAAATLAIAPLGASGQGWVELPVERGGVSVERVRGDVRVRIDGRVAEVEVSEWFRNVGNRVAEGDYYYPLPGEAVFQGFSLYQGETELRGEIMTAEQARDIYEAIVRRRADPALIELAGNGLLRARVFPIEPGDERKITLRYTQVLGRAGSALQFVYAGAVRGTDGRGPGGTPEMARPAPAAQTSFSIEVVEGDDFLQPFSPTHTLTVERRRGALTLGVEGEVRGRMSIFLPLAGEAVGLSVATHRPAGEDGYFMLTLSPDVAAEAVTPRDVTAVLDVSGSMSGEKIIQARQALRQLLASLGREDRFRLLAFSNQVRMSDADWAPATAPSLERARAWVDRLVADGGTNIEAALEEAFRLESPAERLPVVVFLTDGLPSVGEQSPERLADHAEASSGRARVFAFGVGHDVNTHLLDRLGEAGRGSTDYVQPGESVEHAIGLLSAKIRHPVLTDVELECGPISISEVYPVRIPDVFAGQELVLFGRYTGDGQSRVTVVGRRGGALLDFTTESRFPEVSEANDFIPRLWASRKLGHLERQIWTEGETTSLVEEIRTLALRYGLPSRYTSYLVQEPDLGQPTVMPGGRGVPASANRSVAASAPADATGQRAVQFAERARVRREAVALDQLAAVEEEIGAEMGAVEGTRTVAGRTFRLDDGVWIDSGHDEATTVAEIEAFSEAYFALMRALPEVAMVVSELDEVIVAGGRVSLRIGSTGMTELAPDRLQRLVADFRGGEPGR